MRSYIHGVEEIGIVIEKLPQRLPIGPKSFLFEPHDVSNHGQNTVAAKQANCFEIIAGRGSLFNL